MRLSGEAAVDKLVLMEAPLPCTAAYDPTVASTKLNDATMWLFFFHNAQNNLAKSLTAGRERLYLQHFYERLGSSGPRPGLRRPVCLEADAKQKDAT